MAHAPPRPCPPAEPLEPRTLLSSVFPNVNVSRMSGNQAEGSIAADPSNPSRLVAVSNIDAGDGLMVATSGDGGATWASRTIANDSDGLPPACCDPSSAFDSFGNLFLSYIDANSRNVIVLRSTDAGQSFSLLARFHGDIDQPTLTTGPGSVWLTFQKSNAIVATGAADTDPGATGAFLPLQKIRGSTGGNFGDVAIGPAGQVMLTFQIQQSSRLSRIFVSEDPGGLTSPRFGKPTLATTTRVPAFDYIPAQPDRSVDAEAGLAFDRGGGPFDGRAYLLYTEETPAGSGNTEIMLRYSDDQGVTWSQPARVNDDTTLNSQFNPRLSADNAPGSATAGDVAVSWYDARNDQGVGGAGDTDQTPNDDAQFFATVVTPHADGVSVAPDQQISAGTSNSPDAKNDNDYGDYTGLDFRAGTLHPLWFDNSNSTGDNPNGALMGLNAYTANVPASAFAAGTSISLGGLAAGATGGRAGSSAVPGPVAALYFHGSANPGFVKRGGNYVISVTYADAAGINSSSLGDGNLLVTGPGGFSSPARLLRSRTLKGGAVLATYSVTAPGGVWDVTNNGVYSIALEPGQVLNGAGQPSASGILGTFAAVAGRPRGSHAGNPGSRDPDRHGGPDPHG